MKMAGGENFIQVKARQDVGVMPEKYTLGG